MSETTEQEPDQEEAAAFLEICRGQRSPDAEQVAAGRADWEAGKQFHEGPRPIGCVKALSWRIGWNDRALEDR